MAARCRVFHFFPTLTLHTNTYARGNQRMCAGVGRERVCVLHTGKAKRVAMNKWKKKKLHKNEKRPDTTDETELIDGDNTRTERREGHERFNGSDRSMAATENANSSCPTDTHRSRVERTTFRRRRRRRYLRRPPHPPPTP